MYLIFFSTPLESIAIFNEFSLTKLIVVFFIFFSLFNINKLSFLKYRFTKLILIYCFYAMLSVFWSFNLENTFSVVFFNLFPSIILTIFLLHTINHQRHLINIFYSYILGCIIIASSTIYSYYNFYQFQLFNLSRATAFEQDQNELSFLLSFGIVLIFYILQFTQQIKKIKILLLISSFILLYAILVTGSRTGFIILLFIGFVLFITKLNIKRTMLFFPVFLFSSFYVFNLLNETISTRLLTTFSQIESGDLTNRTEIWTTGLNSFFKTGTKVIFGIGYDAFPEFHKKITNLSYGRSVHSTYIGVFIELGIIGLFLFLNIIFHLLKKLLILCKLFSVYYILFLVPILISMLTLGLSKRRWLFLIGVIIIKLFEEYKKSDKQIFEKK